MTLSISIGSIADSCHVYLTTFLIKKNKIFHILKMKPFFAALIVMMSVFNVPLGYGVTTVRMALIFGIAAILLWNIDRPNIAIRGDSVLLVAAGGLATLFGFLSLLFAGGSLYEPISFLLLALLAVITIEVVGRLDINQLRQFVQWIFLLWIIIFALTIINFWGDSSFVVRGAFRDYYTPGLSRFMNALVVSAAIIFVIGALVTLKQGRAISLKYFLPLLFAFVLAAFVGSRQSMLAIILFLFILGFVNLITSYKYKKSRMLINRLIILAVVLILTIISAVQLDYIDSRLAEERYLIFFVEQELRSSDYSRLEFMRAGLQFMFYNNGFGVGFGNFVDEVGAAAHNGYIGILSEAGIISGSAILIICLAVLLASVIRLIRVAKVYGMIFSLVSSFVVMLLFMNFFNGLIRDPLFFVVVGIFYGITNVLRSYHSV